MSEVWEKPVCSVIAQKRQIYCLEFGLEEIEESHSGRYKVHAGDFIRTIGPRTEHKPRLLSPARILPVDRPPGNKNLHTTLTNFPARRTRAPAGFSCLGEDNK